MAIEIIATGRYIPAHRVTNDELSKTVDTNDEWIRSHTGIATRHFAADDEATSDLGYKAALDAFETLSPGHPEETAATIDLVVLTSSTPDYVGFPATACIIQDKLGIKNAGAFDVLSACTGFITAVETASALLQASSRKRALVIGSDCLSRVANWEDRSTCVLFGDAAGAVVLEKTDAPSAGTGKRGIIRSILGSDGSGANALISRRGGSRSPWKKGETVGTEHLLEMDGRAVYNFAVKAITDTMQRLLDEEGLTMADIKKIIPHQANVRIVQAAAKRLGVEETKFFFNMEKYANTSTATIPTALDEYARSGDLKRGDVIMTVGFGAGLSYGGNLIVW
jgi:3-oxoacyl-[acyl-carrier-protein] synthase III